MYSYVYLFIYFFFLQTISLKAPCPKYELEKKRILKEIKQNETVEDKQFFKYVSLHAGQNVDSIREIETLYTCLFIEVSSKVIKLCTLCRYFY